MNKNRLLQVNRINFQFISMFFLGLDMRHYKLNKGKGVQFRAIWDQLKEKRRKREKQMQEKEEEQ